MLTAPQETFPGTPEPSLAEAEAGKIWLRAELRQEPGPATESILRCKIALDCDTGPGRVLDCVSQCQEAIGPSPAES